MRPVSARSKGYTRPVKRKHTVAKHQPQCPVFIPSKGRADSCYTMKLFDRMAVPFTVVVEPQQVDEYAESVGADRLLVTPHRDKGLTFTRNWIWDHCHDQGFERFWTFDDNITSMLRYHENDMIFVSNGAAMRAAEDFVARYRNVPVAGFNYEFFVKRRWNDKPPFDVNRRVYSNMLIETDFISAATGKPYRNETYFNDDTDLCLRILKDGNCTILFNAFLIHKCETMAVSGGNTAEYQGDGRYRMAAELVKAHPDVTVMTKKWGRWQHHVDYRPFADNQLRRRKGLRRKKAANEYGMEVIPWKSAAAK